MVPLASRNLDGYLVPMTERQARDEGATQTKLIMSAVRRQRGIRDWSAAQLAGEMTKAGVPWNADVVVNLEHGRRKSLRVHELIALAYILDTSPLDLLVSSIGTYPVLPGLAADPEAVRAWFRGDAARPIRINAGQASPEVAEAAARLFDEQGKPDMAASMRELASLLGGESGR